MDLTTILIIIGAAIIAILIIAVIFIRISNKKRFKKLQDNIKKYKAENDNFGNEVNVKVSDDKTATVENPTMVEQYVPDNEVPSYQNNPPIIEDYDVDVEDDDDDIPDFIPRRRNRDERRNVYGRDRRASSMLNRTHYESNDNDEDDDDDIPDFIPRRRNRDERRNVYGRDRRASSMLNRTHYESNDNDEDDDFEEFLNEHSYSRRILNNDLIKNLKDLPPDIKAIILSNVFNKYDD